MATQTKERARDDAVIAAADLEPLLHALRAAARGEHVPKLDTRRRGVVGQLHKAFNRPAPITGENEPDRSVAPVAFRFDATLQPRTVTTLHTFC